MLNARNKNKILRTKNTRRQQRNGALALELQQYWVYWWEWLPLHGRQVLGSLRRQVRKDNIRENMDGQDDHSQDQSWSAYRNREECKSKRRQESRQDYQHFVARGSVLMDNMPLKDYGLSGGETIEMTSRLLGGMKHKGLSPKTDGHRKEKKGRNLNRASTWKVSKMKNPQGESWRRTWLTHKMDDRYTEGTETKNRWSIWFWGTSCPVCNGTWERLRGALTRVNESLVKMTESNE